MRMRPVVSGMKLRSQTRTGGPTREMRILLRSKRIHIDRRAARRQLDEFNGVWQSNCGWTPPSFDIRGVGNKRSDGRWPGEGSWPSPQSPKGFSAFLPLTQQPIAREKPKHLVENKGPSESPEV